MRLCQDRPLAGQYGQGCLNRELIDVPSSLGACVVLIARRSQVDRLQNALRERQISNHPNVQGDQSDDVEFVIGVHTSAALTSSPYLEQISCAERALPRQFSGCASRLHLHSKQGTGAIENDVVRNALIRQIGAIARQNQIGHD